MLEDLVRKWASWHEVVGLAISVASTLYHYISINISYYINLIITYNIHSVWRSSLAKDQAAKDSAIRDLAVAQIYNPEFEESEEFRIWAKAWCGPRSQNDSKCIKRKQKRTSTLALATARS